MPGQNFLFFFLVVMLTGCAAVTETVELPALTETAQVTLEITATARLVDSPTNIPTDFPTVSTTATATITPTITPTQTRTQAVPLPTLAPPTLTPTDFPQPAAQSGVIQFYKPGPMSQVTSPVRFYGYAVPGYNRKGVIELFGEDGSLINSEILQLNTDYKWAFFSWSLNFQARGAGELGRLSLSTRDQYDRLTAIRSVRLFLMPGGLEVFTPAEAMLERVVLENPVPGKRIAGGHVLINGEMQSYNEEPLIVELIAADKSIISSQLVPIPAGEGGGYFEFRIDIPYSVRGLTPVLLTICQPDDIIPGIIYLFSQEIILSP